MSAAIRPLGGKIVVEILPPETKVGDLFLPESAAGNGRNEKALVIAVGPKVESELTPGDHVIVAQWGGAEIKIGGKTYRIVNEEEVLCVIRT